MGITGGVVDLTSNCIVEIVGVLDVVRVANGAEEFNIKLVVGRPGTAKAAGTTLRGEAELKENVYFVGRHFNSSHPVRENGLWWLCAEESGEEKLV